MKIDNLEQRDDQDRLLFSVLPFIRQQARRLESATFVSQDDLFQEGVVAVIIAFRWFNPNSGFKPLTYLGKAALRQMRYFIARSDIIRLSDRLVRRRWRYYSQFRVKVEPIYESDDLVSSEPVPCICNESVAIPHYLPKRIAKILRLYQTGKTYGEIGAELGISKQRVAQLARKAKKTWSISESDLLECSCQRKHRPRTGFKYGLGGDSSPGWENAIRNLEDY